MHYLHFFVWRYGITRIRWLFIILSLRCFFFEGPMPHVRPTQHVFVGWCWLPVAIHINQYKWKYYYSYRIVVIVIYYIMLYMCIPWYSMIFSLVSPWYRHRLVHVGPTPDLAYPPCWRSTASFQWIPRRRKRQHEMARQQQASPGTWELCLEKCGGFHSHGPRMDGFNWWNSPKFIKMPLFTQQHWHVEYPLKDCDAETHPTIHVWMM